MKKNFLLFLSLSITFFLLGCTNEVSSKDELSSLQHENDNLKEKNINLQEQVISFKEKIDELEKSQNSPTILNDDIRNLLLDGHNRFFHVSSGGNIKDYKTFDYNGKIYRFLGEDLNKKEKITDYLQKAYTPQIVNEIVSKLNIIEHNDNTAQPEADFGSLLDWRKANYQGLYLDKTTLILNLNVPLGDTGLFDENTVELKYIEGVGWRINTDLYLKNM
jgi:iseA protein